MGSQKVAPLNVRESQSSKLLIELCCHWGQLSDLLHSEILVFILCKVPFLWVFSRIINIYCRQHVDLGPQTDKIHAKVFYVKLEIVVLFILISILKQLCYCFLLIFIFMHFFIFLNIQIKYFNYLQYGKIKNTFRYNKFFMRKLSNACELCIKRQKLELKTL